MSIIHVFWCIALLYAIFRIVDQQKNKKRNKMLEKFKSCPNYPFVGSLLTFYSRGTNIPERILNLSKKCFGGSAFVYWIGFVPGITLSKLNDILLVMSKISHRDCYGIPDMTFGNGIASVGYDKWKPTRRLLNPAFSPTMLARYLIVFNEQSCSLVRELGLMSRNGKVFDAWPYLINANVDAVVENVIGTKLESKGNKNSEFTNAILRNLNLIMETLQLAWIRNPYVIQFYKWLTGDIVYTKIVRELPAEAIKKKKEELMAEKLLPTKEKYARTVLDLLLQTREKDPYFTDEQICTELVHIIAAGSESTAITNGFLFVLLGIYQDIQQKVFEEIQYVLKDSEVVTMDHLSELKYTEQCIRETLRLFTIVPIVFRSTNEEVTLTGGKTIPEGCPVFAVLANVHLNEQLYPNPMQWNPDNFSEENIEKREKNSFLAFGYGPRSCIGYKYAMMAIKTQLCYILRNFHISTNIKFEDIELKTDIALRSKNGYPIRLKLRKDG